MDRPVVPLGVLLVGVLLPLATGVFLPLEGACLRSGELDPVVRFPSGARNDGVGVFVFCLPTRVLALDSDRANDPPVALLDGVGRD